MYNNFTVVRIPYPDFEVDVGIQRVKSYVFTSRDTGIQISIPSDGINTRSETKIMEAASSVLELLDCELSFKPT